MQQSLPVISRVQRAQTQLELLIPCENEEPPHFRKRNVETHYYPQN